MHADKAVCGYCIQTIRAVMQDLPVSPVPNDVSLQKLFAFAKFHSVESLLFHGLSQQEQLKADPAWKTWSNRADLLVTQSIVQLAERDLLFDAITAAGIPLLPVKGSWLKELYPQIDFRQMSDLDMLIRPEDAQKAERVMLGLGYAHGEETNTHHLSFFKKPYMEVELHLSLLPENNVNYTYYRNIWDKVIPVEGSPCLFRLSPEDEYIYYLLHLQHHVLFAGTGIRSFLDSVVYRHVYPNMDQGYLQQEYEKLGIRDFARQIEMLSDCWFVKGSSVPDSLAELEQIVFASGTYGTEERQFQQQVAKINSKYTNPIMISIHYWMTRLFLPKAEIEKTYPVLKTVPVLLPLFWMVRLFAKLFHDPKALMRRIKLVNEIGKKNGQD